jgi:uncharacterized protein
MNTQLPSPGPPTDFVLKVASLCNLKCRYCYVYFGADQSWRNRPRIMSTKTVRLLAEQIRKHADHHQIGQVTITLHGGEPLLLGPVRLRHYLRILQHALAPTCRPLFRLQTNGTLINAAFLEVLQEYDVRVGISLDGNAAHNQSRVFANGQASHDSAARGIRALQSSARPDLFAGILSVIDIANDPLAVYEALVQHEPPWLDFLLPHAHWGSPPPRSSAQERTDYAQWLIPIFDLWFSESPSRTRIRLFEDIIALLIGGASSGDQVGGKEPNYVTIEADGSVELVDSLKVTYPGAAATGRTILGDGSSFPLDRTAQDTAPGDTGLSSTCRRCAIVRVCGGGHRTHRYEPRTGFDNPSVYCTDLTALIRHIALATRTAVA